MEEKLPINNPKCTYKEVYGYEEVALYIQALCYEYKVLQFQIVRKSAYSFFVYVLYQQQEALYAI